MPPIIIMVMTITMIISRTISGLLLFLSVMKILMMMW